MVGVFSSPFKVVEDDHDFKVKNHPELDDYLTTMESRGWAIISVESFGEGILVTFHRPE
jgi:hypothetical protein